MENVLVNEQSLKDIADAIRDKNKTDNTYTPGEMAAAIGEIKTELVTEPLEVTENGVYELPEGVDGFNKVTVETGGVILPEEAYVVSGDCGYRFAYGGWNWYVKTLGNKITTKDMTNAGNMFYSASELEEIPFELNFVTSPEVDYSFMFTFNYLLKSIPKINGKPKVKQMQQIFNGCRNLREVPSDIADWFDWSYIDNLTSGYLGARNDTFNSCFSLRSVPMDFLAHGNPVLASSTGSIYKNLFNQCYALDEVVDLPNPHYNATFNSSGYLDGIVNTCYRLKNFTFAMPDGKPMVVKWKNQTLDLSKDYLGYASPTSTSYILNYNSGITADKFVSDDESYQRLKNDPDWFTADPRYSRYNHDSAVRTINSLPDTSAYLATAGGTNTIKFDSKKGTVIDGSIITCNIGEFTDGGAINTLTAEEIAVATAKGWTVTFA